MGQVEGLGDPWSALGAAGFVTGVSKRCAGRPRCPKQSYSVVIEIEDHAADKRLFRALLF